MKDYFQQSIRALQLAGMSERTQECYTRAVRLFVDFYGKTPDQIGEPELQDYFLHRRNVDKWSSSTLRIAYSGVKFFFVNVLKRGWHIFTYLKSQKERRLPGILQQGEVFKVLGCIRTFHHYACLSTIYACGLRISEALALQVSDIDGKRMMIHVHRGKGAKDRYVPFPQETQQLLCRYWATHRNPVLIFPALGRGHNQASTAQTAMAIESVLGISTHLHGCFVLWQLEDRIQSPHDCFSFRDFLLLLLTRTWDTMGDERSRKINLDWSYPKILDKELSTFYEGS